MSITYYSINSYIADGLTDEFTVQFPYLVKDDVSVFLNGSALIRDVGFEWVDSTTIRILTTVNDQDSVVFRRYTRKDVNWTTFNNGAHLTEDDLQTVNLQHLYLIQELSDWGLVGSDPNPPPGQTEPTEQDLIDAIVTDVLNTQLFQNLTALIPLVDINAEAIIQNSLENHEDWSLNRNLDFLLGVERDRITSVESVTDNQATLISAVETRTDAAEASIVNLQDTKVDEAGATAIAQTEITAAFDAFDGATDTHALASYINGVKATADANEASVDTINSSLVTVNANIAGLQSTTSAHTTQLTAEAAFRQAMFAAFYPAGDVDADLTQMVAAMEEQWETYVDSESALATRVGSLEVNNQPIFFRGTPPNHQDMEFANSEWKNIGFPHGSVWFRQVGSVVERYVWDSSLLSGDFGPFGGITGAWTAAVESQLASVGGRVDTLEAVTMTSTEISAEISSQIQVVLDTSVASVREDMEAWIRKPVDGTPGLMYTGWQVRMNQYISGVPVIAGVGLGMQSDPDNPSAGARSDFIVMADYFSVIKPPTVNPLTGALDQSTAIVPFQIDATNNRVTVNGTLLANTLFNFDGYFGRSTYTALNNDGTPVSASGSRLQLMSGTNGYNQGPDRDYWMWAGAGTMNDNNAVFYIDTNGNAKFGGTVDAININGSMTSAVALSGGSGNPGATQTSWNQIGSWAIAAPPAAAGNRFRDVCGTIVAQLQGGGSNAQAIRLRLRMAGTSGQGPFNITKFESSFPITMAHAVPISFNLDFLNSSTVTVYLEAAAEYPPGGGSLQTGASVSGTSGFMFNVW